MRRDGAPRAAADRGIDRRREKNPFRAVLALTTAPRASAPARQKPSATPPAPKRGLDDNVDSEVARALLRGKHGVEDDPHRTVSPTDVTADVYAAA